MPLSVGVTSPALNTLVTGFGGEGETNVMDMVICWLVRKNRRDTTDRRQMLRRHTIITPNGNNMNGRRMVEMVGRTLCRSSEERGY